MEHDTTANQALLFFNDDDARTVEAMAACIIPSDAASPGATEAGAVFYIDRALAGHYHHLQTFYRRGLRGLDGYCRATHGRPFAELIEDARVAVLADIDAPFVEEEEEADRDGNDGLSLAEKAEAKGVRSILTQFFAVVREHTIEGVFGDPAYGGNRDAVGWKLVGFPGAQWGYSAEQMRPGVDASLIPVSTLADLQRTYRRSK